MTTTQLLVLILALAVAAVVAVDLLLVRERRHRRLKNRFGPEYDRVLERSDHRRDAERELAERAERRDALDIRPLAREERLAFATRWLDAQQDFVDRPAVAVHQADLLVAQVMDRRGYPVGDFDQQVRDVSVDHAHVVDEYRAAHAIAQRNDRGEATTEDLRQAMVHYRALFSDLLTVDDRDAVDDEWFRLVPHQTRR